MNCKQANEISLLSYFEIVGLKFDKQATNGLFYFSPFVAEQTTGSLFLNVVRNVFYCHATNIGGSIIEFVRHYHNFNTVSEVLNHLENTPVQNHTPVTPVENMPQQTKQISNLIIEKVKVLENKALIQYLENNRKIPYQIAKQYVKECYYKVNTSQIKPYFALCFENDKLGYELRNKHFKGSTTPKTITTIVGSNSKQVCVFEGFIDFLSALVYFKKSISEFDVIILNSLANLDSVNFGKYEKIKLYLDNDTEGKKSASKLQAEYSNLIDYSVLYAGYKDFNEMIADK